MEIKINLPQITDKAVCLIKGHAWSDWTVAGDEEKADHPTLVASRSCSRCGLIEKMKNAK